jgi:methylated-DNA-[protein]-cysteine S-methyltransferase
MEKPFAHWAYYQSPFGWLCISGHGAKVAEIKIIEQTPTHFYNPVPDYLLHCIEELKSYFAGQLQVFSTPLDLRKGTDFQQTVWRELLQIPFGKTSTYLKIAEKVADKKTIRAVGGAIGQNPIAILVPCHRVIGTDGSLTGFAWGLDRKEFLLNLENPNHFGLQSALF